MKGLATAQAIAAAAESEVRAHFAATYALALAEAVTSTRANQSPPSKASAPSWGALRAGSEPSPKLEAVKPGLWSRTISRHTISPGRKNGQHTATTSRAPHSPRPQRADLRRAALWRAGLGAGTVAAHVHKGGIGQQDNADDLA